MKTEKLFEIIADINDDYIAGAYKKTTKKLFWIRCVAACLCFVFIGILVMLQFGKSGTGITLSAQAKELGKEEYQFGVALPEIIYSDSNRVIFYDFRGIYVYSFATEKLVGYVDFRKLEMDKIQGDNPTFLNVTKDGCYVRFYNNSQKYIYEVEENSYNEVTDYEDDMENQYQITTINIGEENSVSDEQITYIGEDGSYLAVDIDRNNLENATPKYKNMYILRKEGEISHKYYVFE